MMTTIGTGWAAAAAAVLLGGPAAFLVTGPDPALAQGVGDLAILAAAVLAATACARASRRGGADARGWALLCVAASVWVAAQICWTVYGLTRDHVYPFPSVADIGFLGYAVPAVAGLLAFPRPPARRLTRARGTVDALVIATALLFTSWVVVLGPLARAGGARDGAHIVGLAYPLVDAVVAALVLILAMGRSPADRLHWLVLAGGMLTLTATDTLYVSLTLTGHAGLTGTVLSLGWVGAFLLIGAATLVPARPAAGAHARTFTVVQDLLPMVPVAGAVLAAAAVPVRDDPFLFWTGAVALVLVGARQVLTVVEKAALTDELEDRVQRRTAALRSAQEDLQQAFDNAPVGMVWADPAGVLIEVNPAFCAMTGRTRADLVGSTSAAITHPGDVAAAAQLIARAVREQLGAAPHISKRYLHADGRTVWTEGSVSVIRDPSGTPRSLLAQVQDVSDRRTADRALVDQSMFLEAVLENLDAGVVACDAEGRLTVFNRASREVHGLPMVAVTPESWAEHYDLFRVDGVTPMPTHEIPLLRALRGERVHDVEMVIAPDGGAPRTMTCNGRRISDGAGAVVGAVVAMHDVTVQRRAEAALIHQALHDPLTDLANRALLRDRLGHAIARQARRPEPLSLLLLDLDAFKLVNDSLGHLAGDEVLVAVAMRLRGCLRPYDTIARLGGDEFAVVLESTTEEQALTIAAEILAVLREPVSVLGHAISPDASIGIMVSSAARSPESLLRNADLAMYAAKDRGKGNIEVFTASMHEAVLQRLVLESELREAVDDGQFTLVYQPIVSLVTGSLQGFEALIRWNHPTRGLLAPGAFVPLAESSGLIVPIGRWVLGEACRQAGRWREADSGHERLTMSVNVSVRQLQDRRILVDVAAALAGSGLPAELLQLEITESVLDEGGQACTLLGELHDTGVRLALDDFGTGYSSLGRLHSLPIDRVKIDKSFVDALVGGAPAPMVAATVAMAHSLGLQTVAEGVESVEQLPFLRLHGCDDVQGYLIGRPLAPAAVEGLLRRERAEPWRELTPLAGRPEPG